MRFTIIASAVILLLSIVADTWVYHSLSRSGSKRDSRLRRLYLIGAFLTDLLLIVAIAMPRRGGSNGILVADMWMLYTVVSLLTAKILYLFCDLFSYIPRLWHRGTKIRWHFFSVLGIIVSWGTIITLAWGSIINRNRISVTQIEVSSPHITPGIDGLRIAHISDLHVGTWGNDTTFLSRAVDSINALNPDIIIFSGDIVNRASDELRPFIPTLSHLNAPLGVYAVRGNHDYGDYRHWDSECERGANLTLFKELYDLTSIKLLDDTTVVVKHGTDSLAIMGVQNISSNKRFHTYGSLEKAMESNRDQLPAVLITHDPSHWYQDIRNKDGYNIPLTLSGHTHAMQFQIADHTPAIFSSHTPWGLYTDSCGHNLYVNRGLGTVGIPARVGATPEITLITLRHDAKR